MRSAKMPMSEPPARHELIELVHHGEHDFVAVFFFELDADARIGVRKARDVLRQELRDRRGVAPQAHHADEARCVVREIGRELVDIAEDALRMPLQRLPCDGERDAA